MRCLAGHSIVLVLAFFAGQLAEADPMYKYNLTVDNTTLTIDEGQQSLVHYSLKNLGTEPFWVFTFSLSASLPVTPDPTDSAGARYFGPDASGGVEVKAGGTFDFGYRIFTPRADRKPEHKGDPDFGVRVFTPNIAGQLREGDKITTHPLPPNSGTTPSFAVKVVDAPVPEPMTSFLTGGALALLLARCAVRRRYAEVR